MDGKLSDARMSHPRGLTVDQRGNIYIADTKNRAIRKISDAGTFLNQFESVACLDYESCLLSTPCSFSLPKNFHSVILVLGSVNCI